MQMNSEKVPRASEAAAADGASVVAEQILSFLDQGKI